MSLEQKIEELNNSINNLIKALGAQGSVASAVDEDEAPPKRRGRRTKAEIEADEAEKSKPRGRAAKDDDEDDDEDTAAIMKEKARQALLKYKNHPNGGPEKLKKLMSRYGSTDFAGIKASDHKAIAAEATALYEALVEEDEGDDGI